MDYMSFLKSFLKDILFGLVSVKEILSLVCILLH